MRPLHTIRRKLLDRITNAKKRWEQMRSLRHGIVYGHHRGLGRDTVHQIRDSVRNFMMLTVFAGVTAGVVANIAYSTVQNWCLSTKLVVTVLLLAAVRGVAIEFGLAKFPLVYQYRLRLVYDPEKKRYTAPSSAMVESFLDWTKFAQEAVMPDPVWPWLSFEDMQRDSSLVGEAVLASILWEIQRNGHLLPLANSLKRRPIADLPQSARNRNLSWLHLDEVFVPKGVECRQGTLSEEFRPGTNMFAKVPTLEFHSAYARLRFVVRAGSKGTSEGVHHLHANLTPSLSVSRKTFWSLKGKHILRWMDGVINLSRRGFEEINKSPDAL